MRLQGCKIATGDGAVTFDGTFALQATALTLDLEMQFENAAGASILHASADIHGTVSPSLGGSCVVTALTLTISDGHLTAPSPGGQDLHFAGTQVAIGNMAFDADTCVPTMYRLAFNGPATLMGSTGQPLPIRFDSLATDIAKNSGITQLGFSGSMSSDCFGGEASLATDPRLTIPSGSACPVAGTIVATLPAGRAQIMYRPDQSVAIDANGDGTVDQTAPNWLDPRLLMCAS